MSAQALYHRLGVVLEIVSTSEQRNPAGRTKVYTRCRVKWDDNGEPGFLDLSETYAAGDRTAVIYRGENYICDVNLATGRQSQIGDRLEGVAALIKLISIPLCLILIGIPVYWGVTLYSSITTKDLRRRVAVYVSDLIARLTPASPSPAA